MEILTFITAFVLGMVALQTYNNLTKEDKKEDEPKHTYKHTEPTMCVRCNSRKISQISSNYLCNTCEDRKWGY